MNKASFLTLVRQASRISDQDVEELEKLVVNFPYCQTAHLLIAKAAYDKGSMLSNQKLKKAAIYAANRQLLKKLIYTSDATVSLHPLENPETVSETPEKVKPEEKYIPAQPHLPEPEILEETETHEVDLDADITGTEITARPETDLQATEQNTELLSETEASEAAGNKILAETKDILAQTTEIKPELTIAETQYEDAAIAEEILEEGWLPESEAEFLGIEAQTFSAETTLTSKSEFLQEKNVAESAAFELAVLPAEIKATPEPANLIEIPVIHAEPETIAEETVGFETEKIDVAIEEPASESAPFEEKTQEIQDLVAEAAHTLEDVPDLHELFLENAPETLHEEPEPQPVSEENFEIPGQPAYLDDDLLHETLASFDQYLFKPEKEQETDELAAPEEDLKVVYPENEIRYIYDNDSLGYWMNSSRMGESLQLKNELTKTQPQDFHPELIWEYSKTHELQKEIKPAPSNLSKQLEIIDEFLKMTPRLKTMGNTRIKTEPQEDLSSKSSKINKNLASENFANILVKQGKIKKAIKIYEHLILKIPEKKPYFVAQIEKLQNME